MMAYFTRGYHNVGYFEIWSQARFNQASAEDDKPVLIDLSAEWCAACKELEARTFADPQVEKELRRFVLLKLDATETSETLKEFQSKYGIRGLPTILFFDRTGRFHPVADIDRI